MLESTIQEIFRKNIKSGSKSGITFLDSGSKPEFLSYKKLYLKATCMLHNLQQRGLQPGDELVFQFQSNQNFLVTFWACVFGKIIPVPVTFGVSQEGVNKLASVWRKLNNPSLITDFSGLSDIVAKFEATENQAVLEEIQARLILFSDQAFSMQAEPLPASPDDLVFIQFSSGSTGSPKGVMNRQDNILYNINNSIKYLGVKSDDRFLGWMPLTHDMGLVFFHLLPLVLNANQCLIPPVVFLTYPGLWLSSLATQEITVSGSPNFGYKHALDNMDKSALQGLSFEKLRIMISSAEPVSIKVCRDFTSVLAPYGFGTDVISPGYGLAEAVLGVSLCLPDMKNKLKEHHLNRHRLNVGDVAEFIVNDEKNAASFADLGPFYGTEIKITDTSGKTLPEGTLGYVHLRSQAVTTGYYNDPLATKKALSEDGWFDTGDLGLLNNGHLVITGREKEMILINGQNYFPNDLDKVIEELPSVKFQQAASCNIFNNEKHQDDICVFVVFEGSVRQFVPLANSIRRHVRQRVGLRVKHVIQVNKIPKTTSGKVQRYILRDQYFSGLYDEFLTTFEEESAILKSHIESISREELEKRIIQAANDILNVKEITGSTNFFDMGATSLQIMQLNGNIEAYIDEGLDEVVMFKYTNAKDLAKYIHDELLNSNTGIEEQDRRDLSLAKARMKRLIRQS